jgi:hypothetical protein
MAAETLPPEFQSAETLLKIDSAVQKFTSAIDKELTDAVKRLPKRQTSEPDDSCVYDDGVVPVSLVVQTLYLGMLRVIFRSLPSLVKPFIEEQILSLLNKVAAKFLARTLAKKIPLAGDVGAAIGKTVTAAGFMNQLETSIHDSLGCGEDGVRLQFNELAKAMKERSEGKTAPLGKVATRNP